MRFGTSPKATPLPKRSFPTLNSSAAEPHAAPPRESTRSSLAGSETETNDLLSQGVDDVLQEPIDAGRYRARVTSVMRSRGLWMETEEVMRPLIPQDEAERLVEFRLSAAIDSEPEERFDKISRMAQRVFTVPFAAVSFVEGERQWFKSKQGLLIGESSRDLSFCGHAITGTEAFVVDDAAHEPRFAQH